jgi:hypothetical protein
VQVAGSTIIDGPSTTTPGSGGSLYAFLLTEKVSHSFHFVFGNSQHLYRIIGICFVYHDIALSLRKLFLFEKARQLSQMMIIETSYVTANRQSVAGRYLRGSELKVSANNYKARPTALCPRLFIFRFQPSCPIDIALKLISLKEFESCDLLQFIRSDPGQRWRYQMSQKEFEQQGAPVRFVQRRTFSSPKLLKS